MSTSPPDFTEFPDSACPLLLVCKGSIPEWPKSSTTDLPDHSLKAGDLGTVVLVHEHSGCEVEFMTLGGETVAVVSLSPDQVRPVGHREMAHARLVTME